MPLTHTNMLLYTRELYLDTDTDTTRQALSDTELTRLLNRNLHWLLGKFSPRWVHEDAATLGTTFAAGEKKRFLTPQTIAEVKHVFRTTTGPVAVACSASSGSVTLTTAGSFGALVVGMNVSHTNIPARTFIKSIESTISMTLSDKTTGVISAASVTFDAVAGKPLTLDDYGRVTDLQDADAVQAPPLIYGLRRSGAATVDGVGNIEIALWPIPGETYYVTALVRYEATELSAGADKPDILAGDDYTLCEMAAAMAARLSGRPELADALVQGLPDPMRAQFIVALRSIQPRTSQAEAGVA